MVESLAQERGLIATFMPKPFAHLTGNGCHFHMSLWKDGENVFDADPADDPRGLGLSELAYQFIGGLKAHAKAYIAVTAPTVNSYKRLVVGAPTQRRRRGRRRTSATATTTARRCCGSPTPAGSRTARSTGRATRTWRRPRCWPRDWTGSSAGSTPGEPNSAEPVRDSTRRSARSSGIEMLPANLLDATRELERDDVLRDALGRARDGDYIDYFVEVKRREWQQAHEQITQWELDRYLQLF